ncbi:hypothetical protein TRFO_12094 [Tritrichomonas foetus]|uniref:Uncharacterized protein n=1 Tax=Tritrichomonas foetus TaxID=1144522 RepID=A0A1J4J2V7_9EUKA|nr:hypothetical protein TRFO_12094 [Tritrichomonas foetus]|eukprot:OHS93073.1 hypothetical protein TRFO_12094 [Tritrichomonas foetus]
MRSHFVTRRGKNTTAEANTHRWRIDWGSDTDLVLCVCIHVDCMVIIAILSEFNTIAGTAVFYFINVVAWLNTTEAEAWIRSHSRIIKKI